MVLCQATNIIANLLNAHRCDIGHRMTLCIVKGQLIIIPRCTMPGDGIEIVSLTPDDLRDGLRNTKWDLIENILRFLIKEKKL